MKKIYSVVCFFTVIFLFASSTNANNCIISTIPICTQQDGAANTTKIKFSVKWENSWRNATNFDAIWVFAKYQKVSSGLNSSYLPCTLGTSDANHSVTTTNGVAVTIRATSDGKGVYMYRTNNGTGNINWRDVLLQWNYGTEIDDTTRVRIKVFAVEMVYVPQGSFYVGDGLNDGFQFQKTLINTATATTIADRTSATPTGGYPATMYTGGAGLLLDITAGGTGTGLTLSQTLGCCGGLTYSTTPTIVNPGSGYSANQWVKVIQAGSNNDASFQIATVSTGGTGLTLGITGLSGVGTGTGCTASVTTSGGVISGTPTVVAGGSNYTVGQWLLVSSGGMNARYQIASTNTGGGNAVLTFGSAGGTNTGYSNGTYNMVYVGGISTYSISSGGSGYTVGQTVTISQSGNTTATAKVSSVSGGVVTGLTITSSGSNYYIGSATTTTGAAGMVCSMYAPACCSDLGTGYTSNAVGAATFMSGPITAATVNQGGYGYSVGQTFAVLQGVVSQGVSYSKYDARVVVTGVSPSPIGAVTTVSVSVGGTMGYQSATAVETNSYCQSMSGVQNATKYGCTLNLTFGGSLSSGFTITSGGMNYYPGDLLTVVQGGNITGQIIVTGTSGNPGAVTSAMVHSQSPGSAYSSGAATTRADENFNGYPSGLYSSNVQNNPNYPNGYNAFMCMKYEVCNGAFADFMNTLSYSVQTYQGLLTNPGLIGSYITNSGSHDFMGVRVQTVGNASLPAVWGTSVSGTNGGTSCGSCLDGRDVACTGLSPKEMVAWLDWAGLRPMSEMEYEKACRGPVAPVAGEYAWGSTNIYDRNTMWPFTNYDEVMNQRGAANDSSEYLTSISNVTGNAAFGGPGYGYLNISGNTYFPYTVPMKNGQFASAIARNYGLAACTRENTGASYWGIMELSGNLAEFCYAYKAKYMGGNMFTYYESSPPFQGQSGDGITYQFWPGGADVSGWTNGSDGWCYRGGSFKITTRPTNGRISDRVFSPKYHYNTLEAGLSWGNYDNWIGFRGVRSVASGW